MATAADIREQTRRFRRTTSSALTWVGKLLQETDLQPPNGNLSGYRQQTEILDALTSYLFETSLALRKVVKHRQRLEGDAVYQQPEPELAALFEQPPEAAAEAPQAGGYDLRELIETVRETGFSPEGLAEHLREEVPLPAPPPAPVYDVRPDDERQFVLAKLDRDLFGYGFPGEVGQLELKAIICRMRCLSWEQRQLGTRDDMLSVLWERVREVREATCAEAYLPPLDRVYSLDDPFQWERLSTLYDRLALARDALTWLEAHKEQVKPAEAQEILSDAVGAHLQISRFYEQRWHGMRGDYQVAALGHEIRYAGRHFPDVRIPWLHVEPTDEELEHRLTHVGEHFLRTRDAAHRRIRQDRAVSALVGMLDEPRDWSAIQSVERLCDACAEVLESGLPPSNPMVRETLIPMVHLLHGDARLERLVREVEKEILRRDQAQGTSQPRKKTKDEQLTEEQLAVLREARPLTEGKKLVILGGDPRREQSRSIQEALHFSTVHWPKMKPHGGAKDYESDIRKGEVVLVLTNFLKIPLRQFRDIAERHGARIVTLPQGWSPTQVAQQILEQLQPKEIVPAAA